MMITTSYDIVCICGGLWQSQSHYIYIASSICTNYLVLYVISMKCIPNSSPNACMYLSFQYHLSVKIMLCKL